LTWALSTPENNPDLKEHEIKELKAKAEKAKSGQKEDSKKQRMEAFAASKQEPKARGRPSALRKSAASDHPADARCKSKTEKGGPLKRKVRCEKESSENELDSEEPLSDPEDSDGSKPAVPKAHATRKPKEIKGPVPTQKAKAGAALAVLALGHSVGKQQAEDAKNGKEQATKRDRGMAKKDEGLTEKKAKKDSGKQKKEHEEKLPAKEERQTMQKATKNPSKKEVRNAETEPKETKSKSKEKKNEKNLMKDTKEKKTRNNSQDPGNTEKKVKAADALKQMVSKKDNKVIDDKVSKRPKTESQSKRPRSGSLPKEHPDKQPRTKMALNRGRSSVALPSVASKVRSSSSNSTGAHVQVAEEVVEAKAIANKTNAHDKSVADGGSDSDATTVRLGQEPEHVDGDVEKDDDESNESQDENGDKKVESEEEKDGSEEEDQGEKEEEEKSEEAHCTRKIPTNFQALSQNICFSFWGCQFMIVYATSVIRHRNCIDLHRFYCSCMSNLKFWHVFSKFPLSNLSWRSRNRSRRRLVGRLVFHEAGKWNSLLDITFLSPLPFPLYTFIFKCRFQSP